MIMVALNDAGEQFTLRGFLPTTVIPGVTEVTIIDAVALVPVAIPIAGAVGPPDPVLTARINGLASQVEAGTTIPLTASLLNEQGGEAEPYDQTRWTWSVVSGDAFFQNVDDLVVGLTPGPLTVRVQHNVEGVFDQDTVQIVGEVLLTAELILPTNVVEGGEFDLRARVLDDSGQVTEQYDPARWTFQVLSGPGSITGANGDVLSVQAGSAPGSIEVRATHVSAGFDDGTANVVAPSAFPENMPTGFTVEVDLDGSTTDFAAQCGCGGWFVGAEWENPNRVLVVNDGNSKFGSAVEKRWFVGDPSGWSGLISLRNLAFPRYREVYIRMVMAVSPNWQDHSAGTKYIIASHGVGFYDSPGRISDPDFFLGGPVAGRRTYPDGDISPSYAVYIPIKPGTPPLEFPASKASDIEDNPDIVPWLRKGEYHTIEMNRRTASGPSNLDQDGYIRLWLNGVEYTRFSFRSGYRVEDNGDITLSNFRGTGDPRVFPNPNATIELVSYWGGSGDTKSRNDHIRLSEYVWAGKDPV